jgi:hypothetical protein
MSVDGAEQCKVPKLLYDRDIVGFQTLVFGAAGSNFVCCQSRMEYYNGLLLVNMRAF